MVRDPMADSIEAGDGDHPRSAKAWRANAGLLWLASGANEGSDDDH